MGDLLKSSRPGHHLGELNFSAYTLDQDLCIVQTIRHFLQKTCSLRGSVTRLFITSQKPHKAISRDMLSRWMKSVMNNAGIDVSMFRPHSTRAASSSAVHAMHIPISTILRTVGWSKDCVFRKYYNKPVVMDTSYSTKLLDNFK